PSYGFLYLQNNAQNTISFGYAPYFGATTQNPPTPGQMWPADGITGVEVVSMPFGWINAVPQGDTLYISCNDASGTLDVNLLTPCGWSFARLSLWVYKFHCSSTPAS